MLLYFTKYIATITAAVTLNVILFMKNISSQISSVWSQSVSRYQYLYTNNRLALCQSGSFYLISSHLYQVDSFSFFSWRDSALPPCLPGFCDVLMMNNIIAARGGEYLKPFVEVRYYTFLYHSPTQGLYSFTSCLPQLWTSLDYWQRQVARYLITTVRSDCDVILCQDNNNNNNETSLVNAVYVVLHLSEVCCVFSLLYSDHF